MNCKHCKVEIAAPTKVCPKCGKNPSMAPVSSLTGLLIGGGLLAAMGGGIAWLVHTTNGAKPAIVQAAPVRTAPTEEQLRAFNAGLGDKLRADGLAAFDVEIDAAALWKAYDENEVAADVQFKGKALLVKGTITSIDKDFMDNVIVHLKTPNMFSHVAAALQVKEVGKAAALKKGSKVTVLCRGKGRMVGSPRLDNCTIQ